MSEKPVHSDSGRGGEVARIIVGELLPLGSALGELVLRQPTEFFDLAHGAFAKNTVLALRSGGKIFRAWCDARGRSWLPADPTIVVDFVRNISTTSAW